MHDTPHETAESTVPSPPGPLPVTEPSPGPGDPSRVSPEIVVKLIGLIDEFERLFRDEPSAWAAIEAEIEERKARREARRAAGRPEYTPAPPGASRREPRPYVGFDRERATYERAKPSLLESAEGKWITIVGDEILGPFDDFADAHGAGLDRFGLGPLYIKQVLAQEKPVYLPYYVDLPCQT